jgi:hypothetical protein
MIGNLNFFYPAPRAVSDKQLFKYSESIHSPIPNSILSTPHREHKNQNSTPNMAPPTSTETTSSTPITLQSRKSTQEASAQKAKVKMNIPKPPTFDDKMKEREYLKGRLAAAFRIFGKNGYDEGTFPLLPLSSLN